MNLRDLFKKQYMIPIILGVIAILMMYIIILLVLPGRGQRTETDLNSDAQQNITDYAEIEKQPQDISGLLDENLSIKSEEDRMNGNAVSGESDDSSRGSGEGTSDQGENIIADEDEDENDISYSKEYILNEALPYFEANNHAAIWDLAHLKRYIKLSSELKGTDEFYYIGDMNSSGKPDGKGLAIYEDNSYYYGNWSDGVRSGNGRWFRFYINEKSERTASGIYTSHSYAGEWIDDLPNGPGAEHFDVDTSQIGGSRRIIQNVVGNFSDGLYDGDMFANTVNHAGIIEEWFGSASKGVFSLWRDMSSIGECSVWRNDDDQNLFLDIDKSENKDQGIRELVGSGKK